MNLFFKTIIILTFILNIIFLYSNYKNNYYFEVKLIKLNNNNYGTDENVVDYICTPGLEVYHSSFFNNWFYVSAWDDAKVHKGFCVVKIKKRK